jgi:nitrogen fixation/metabolism regulation signal transduction histidine kinase
MIWNKHGVKLFGFLGFISLVGFGLFWSVYSNQLIITNLVFLCVFLLSFFWLLRYLNKTNHDLNQFLQSIQFLDNIPVNKSSNFSQQQLQLTYHKIIDRIKDAWLEKESESQYFKYVLEEIGVGIISYDKQLNVEIYNKTARELFGFENLSNLSTLNTLKSTFVDELNDIKSGSTALMLFNGKIENLKILVRAVDIKIDNRNLRLISFQNIKTQLEQSELEAWQKLIRVLTHEIMNSVTPIKSLTYSMQKSLTTNASEHTENILKGLKAIENRSKGLLDFVDSYKNLTQIPKPNYERVELNKMFYELVQLFKKEIESENILFTTEIEPKNISVVADGKLLMQVLINLIKNSVYALDSQSEKKIRLTAQQMDDEEITIQVFDNGKGIPEDIIDKIFVPFYTTRTKGSGIGLSFARQVMVMHNANIEVQSKQGEYTLFTIRFKDL